MYTQTTHVSLLARLAEGPQSAAWREFWDRYGELIHGMARRQGVQPADCDDVVQDVLLALTQAMPGFEYDPARGKFRSYLKTIVLRAIFRKRRRKRGQLEVEDLEAAVADAARDPAVDETWEKEWRQYHLSLAMKTIAAEFNDGDRAAFDAYVGEGRPVREVAEALGMSVDQVYQAKSRISRRLTQLIEGQVAEEG